MIVKNASFVKSATKADHYPDTGLSEIAFAGRSNVGKSSLINGLINRKNLARSGSKQGMTRLINFFNIDDRLHFVDLPGYGFALVAKDEKDKWGTIVDEYLHESEHLKLLLLLVDIRHKPTADDKLMLSWIESMEIDYIIVATKADKLAKTQIHRHLKIIKEELATEGKILPVSVTKKIGLSELWKEIEKKL